MKGRVPWGGPLPPPVDLIVIGEPDTGSEAYCRNWQGLHVPITTLTQQQRQHAWANRRQFERQNND